MEKWERLPEGFDSASFTEIRLDPETVRSQLQQLPPAPAPAPLSAEVAALQQWSVAGSLEDSPLNIRRNQLDFTEAEKEAFKDAVRRLVADGTYRDLVLVHADMSHMMHGSMGPEGLLRFLPWHRRYLVEFERALQDADRILRPQAELPISLPYWHWADDFPGWLLGFLPARNPANGDQAPPRGLREPPERPSAMDIELVRKHFRNQLPDVSLAAESEDYIRFTYALEGWGSRPDGTSLPAHNHVHDWIGGIMGDPRLSPTDPVFWLHHAEVDRIWHDWQKEFNDSHPPLSGDDRILDPWVDSYDQVRAVEELQYTYG